MKTTGDTKMLGGRRLGLTLITLAFLPLLLLRLAGGQTVGAQATSHPT